jgi:hypothetical protein
MFLKPTQPELDYHALEVQAKATIETWMQMQMPVFSMMTEINGRLFDQAIRVNKAWLDLIGRQIDQEIENTRRFLGCRTMQDVMTTCREVVESTQREVKIEIDEISRINREAAHETVAAFREGLSEAAHDLRH